MPQTIAGTFVSGSTPNNGQISDVLLVPTSATAGHRVAVFNITGDISAANTVTVQRTTNGGTTWGGYWGPLTSAQVNVASAIPAANGAWQYRLVCDMSQPGKTIYYSMSAEGP